MWRAAPISPHPATRRRGVDHGRRMSGPGHHRSTCFPRNARAWLPGPSRNWPIPAIANGCVCRIPAIAEHRPAGRTGSIRHPAFLVFQQAQSAPRQVTANICVVPKRSPMQSEINTDGQDADKLTQASTRMLKTLLLQPWKRRAMTVSVSRRPRTRQQLIASYHLPKCLDGRRQKLDEEQKAKPSKRIEGQGQRGA